MNFKSSLIAVAAVLASVGASAETFDANGLVTFENTAFAAAGSFKQTFTFDGLVAGSYSILGDISASNLQFSSITLDGNVWELTADGKGRVRFGSIEYTGTKPVTLVVEGSVLAGKQSQATFDGSIRVTPVPEPETYALMLAGLGAVGFVARRRKAG